MNNISIIGSDSFIASKLYDAIKKDIVVTSFAIKSSGKSSEKVIDLFSITEEDFKGSDVVINFAAIVHQPKLKDDALYQRVNTELPIHLAVEAKKAGVKHFIQISTIAVYGDVDKISVDSIEIPTNIYGQTKLNADLALLDLQDLSFGVTIVRPPMVYGGGKAPGNLLNLINAAFKGIPMPFKGVSNKRDFIHVDNLVLALISIVNNEIFGIVIPTDRKAVSSYELVKIIKKYSSKKVIVIKIPGIIRKLINIVNPNIYKKVFGSLEVECNLDEQVYKPIKSIEIGIQEMLNSK